VKRRRPTRARTKGPADSRRTGHETCAQSSSHQGETSGKETATATSSSIAFPRGDAYYVGPGHTPVLYAGTEVVEFSPTEELGRTMEVVTKNMEEMASS
jgi:hypothetical protein